MENGDQGKVILIFEVTKDGAIENIAIKQGVCESLNNEAVRLVKEMPNWIPGELKREIVRTKVTIPINFTMDVH